MPARHNDIIPQRMQKRSPGLHIYEDTRLMQENGPAAAQPSLGFQLYEDTQFISTPAAASALAARMQPLALQVGLRLECTLTQRYMSAALASSGLSGWVEINLKLLEYCALMHTNGSTAPLQMSTQGYELLDSVHVRRLPFLQADMAPVDSLGTPMMPGGHEGHTAYLAENVRPAIPHAPPSESFNSPTKNKVQPATKGSQDPLLIHVFSSLLF